MDDCTETVILIHGLWRHGVVLQPYQRWMRAEGFAVRRFSYRSWRDGMAANLGALSGFIQKTLGAVIHLVGHSLGGLLALELLARAHDPRIRRAVLLGTPSAGSYCGSRISKTPVLCALLGKTVKDWAGFKDGAEDSVENRFGAKFGATGPALSPSVEIGVIAGSRGIGFGRLVPGLPRPNDGLIAVDETFLAEAKDSIVLAVNHSGMLVSRSCARQVAGFLRCGSFVHG